MTEAEQQAHYDNVFARETERLRVIITSRRPAPLQPLAEFIGYETSLPAETALAILEVAQSQQTNVVNAEILRQALAELAAHLNQTVTPKKEQAYV